MLLGSLRDTSRPKVSLYLLLLGLLLVAGLSYPASASPGQVLEVRASEASLGTANVVNAAGETGAATIVGIAKGDGSRWVYIRVCRTVAGYITTLCDDYSKEVTWSEYHLYESGYILTEIEGLGQVDIEIFGTGGPYATVSMVYPETRSAATSYADTDAGGWVDEAGVLWGSKIGSWRTTTGSDLGINGVDLTFSWTRF